jgi:hypothetical protein
MWARRAPASRFKLPTHRPRSRPRSTIPRTRPVQWNESAGALCGESASSRACFWTSRNIRRAHR